MFHDHLCKRHRIREMRTHLHINRLVRQFPQHRHGLFHRCKVFAYIVGGYFIGIRKIIQFRNQTSHIFVRVSQTDKQRLFFMLCNLRQKLLFPGLKCILRPWLTVHDIIFLPVNKRSLQNRFMCRNGFRHKCPKSHICQCI